MATQIHLKHCPECRALLKWTHKNRAHRWRCIDSSCSMSGDWKPLHPWNEQEEERKKSMSRTELLNDVFIEWEWARGACIERAGQPEEEFWRDKAEDLAWHWRVAMRLLTGKVTAGVMPHRLGAIN